jgi:hypothetical protein
MSASAMMLLSMLYALGGALVAVIVVAGLT